MHDIYERPPPEDDESDTTVELPPRFDENGRRMPDQAGDPFAEKLQEMFAGKGLAGGLFKRIAGDFMGGGGGDDSDGESSGGRRRRRGRR